MNNRLYSFGPFRLDIAEQVLLRDGQSLSLKPKVFNVLAVLVENSGRVVYKDELMKRVWADSFVEEGNLAVSIFEIRKVLREGQNGHQYIETVPRRGYRFVATVTESTRQIVAMPATERDSKSVGNPAEGTIAVLPFKSIGATGDEYLGLGVADALITRLSNLRQVTVRPTSSVRKYQRAKDPVVAGKELGVECVLDGSIQTSGKRIRVTVQFVNVSDGVLLWAEKFDEKFTSIFAVEDSISEKVTRALSPKLTGEERRALAKRYTQNAGAYDAYLKGRFFFDKRTEEGLTKSIDYFNQAIKLDPEYALAYTGLADAYNLLHTYSSVPLRESDTTAERALTRALELDPYLAEAHASLGHLRTRQCDWTTAEFEFERAIELSPNYATAHGWFALHLVMRGRSAQAIEEINTALALDPLSLTINLCAGSVLYLGRFYEAAVEQFEKTLELDPAFAVARFCLGHAHEAQAKYEEAAADYSAAKSTFGDVSEVTAAIGRIQALLGRKKKARAIISELTRQSQCRYVQPSFIAVIYIALGENDEAIEWLERAYEERDADLGRFGIDPRMDSLREDPRFIRLLQRLGLAVEPCLGSNGAES